jgi:hypothetical protein
LNGIEVSDKLLYEKPNVRRSPGISLGEVRALASQNAWIEGSAVDHLKKTAELFSMKVAVGLPDSQPGKGSPIGAAFVALVGNDTSPATTTRCVGPQCIADAGPAEVRWGSARRCL